MKRLIIIKGIILALLLIALPRSQAQGTVYLSNLNQTTLAGAAVGSDAWLATCFLTGANADGYVLDSIELAMASSIGSPSGFTVMLYSAVSDVEYYPGTSLGTFSGSMSPMTGGIFTYTAPSDLLLSPNTSYFIVLTAETTVSSGAFEYNYSGPYSESNDGWFAPEGNSAPDNYQSVNGSTWNWIPDNNAGNLQYSLTATAVPEPGELGLTAFGILLIGFRRWQY